MLSNFWKYCSGYLYISTILSVSVVFPIISVLIARGASALSSQLGQTNDINYRQEEEEEEEEESREVSSGHCSSLLYLCFANKQDILLLTAAYRCYCQAK